MTYQEIAVKVRQLPLRERLELLEVLTRSVRDELASHTQPESTLARIRGIGKPNGPPPGDAEIEAEYTQYLLEKYS